jgi:hypothetical protein
MGFASRFISHLVLPILANEHITKRLIDYSKSSSSLPHPPIGWANGFMVCPREIHIMGDARKKTCASPYDKNTGIILQNPLVQTWIYLTCTKSAHFNGKIHNCPIVFA